MNEIKENSFFIPKKLVVGFNNRTDTYTGKLGYVTYYDHTNKLRKKASWESWRNDKIEPMNVDNVPTSGFILNRSAGGGRGWNHRNTYARVWDPRGFEIEISIENLLWILDWCDCSAGKKLSGNFVYSWYGTDLVLMPENSDDYKASMEVSEKMFKKTSFKESDLVPGTLYKFKGKRENELVYIGKVKFAINFGKEYIENLVFVNPDDNYNCYAHDKNIKTSDHLYIKKPVSIIAEIKHNYFSNEQINEYIHRFNISAYSQYFWTNIKDVVDKFIPSHPQINDGYNELTEVHYVNRVGKFPNDKIVNHLDKKCTRFEKDYKILPDWADSIGYDYTFASIKYKSANELRADISEDGKFVTLKEPLYKMYKQTGYYNGYTAEIRTMFDFATIDLNSGIINKICDPGIIRRISSFYDRMEEIEHNYESEPGEYDKACNNDYPLDVTDNRTFLYYITKDGYISTTLQQRLVWDYYYNNVLRFNTTEKNRKTNESCAWGYNDVIIIPRKITD